MQLVRSPKPEDPRQLPPRRGWPGQEQPPRTNSPRSQELRRLLLQGRRGTPGREPQRWDTPGRGTQDRTTRRPPLPGRWEPPGRGAQDRTTRRLPLQGRREPQRREPQRRGAQGRTSSFVLGLGNGSRKTVDVTSNTHFSGAASSLSTLGSGGSIGRQRCGASMSRMATSWRLQWMRVTAYRVEPGSAAAYSRRAHARTSRQSQQMPRDFGFKPSKARRIAWTVTLRRAAGSFLSGEPRLPRGLGTTSCRDEATVVACAPACGVGSAILTGL
jgi:hypothetical protein